MYRQRRRPSYTLIQCLTIDNLLAQRNQPTVFRKVRCAYCYSDVAQTRRVGSVSGVEHVIQKGPIITPIHILPRIFRESTILIKARTFRLLSVQAEESAEIKVEEKLSAHGGQARLETLPSRQFVGTAWFH